MAARLDLHVVRHLDLRLDSPASTRARPPSRSTQGQPGLFPRAAFQRANDGRAALMRSDHPDLAAVGARHPFFGFPDVPR